MLHPGMHRCRYESIQRILKPGFPLAKDENPRLLVCILRMQIHPYSRT